MSEHAYKIVDSPRSSPLVLTCEHASNHVPEWLNPTDIDRRVLLTHWGWDIGSADVATYLASHFSAPAVLCAFSRLVIDPNRDPTDDTLILTEVDGLKISFNADVTEAERERRFSELYDPYHDAVDALLDKRLSQFDGKPLLFSVHSFTPELGGRPRPMEMGVLYDLHEEPAGRLASALEVEGFRTELNKPYSGFDNVISSARRHGRDHDLTYLELEIRQDLLESNASRRNVAERVANALETLFS